MNHEELTTWKASDWDELREIWSQLVPPPLEEKPTEFSPRFRDHALTPKQAGYVFENWIREALRVDGVDTQPAYKVPTAASNMTAEEIDGFFHDGWQAFLIETKHWNKNVDFTPIALMQERLQRRLPNVLGLIFSSRAFTPPAVELAGMIRPARILLFDRQDLEHAMKLGNLMEVVRTKWELAAKFGVPHHPTWKS